MKIVIDGQEVELASGGNEEGGLSQEEADERYLQLSGGKVTGPVEVPAPAAEGQAATKGYVDGVLAGKLDKTATAAAATKLATAIIQNLSKGNAEIVKLFRSLNDESWMEHKHNARRMGEKIQSKLLLPTMLMFGGIIILVIVPVMSGFSF